MFKVEFIMSNQSDHDHDTKSILNDVSRRHFIQASSALVTLPFLASNSFAATTDNAIPVKSITTEEGERVVSTCSSFDCGGKCDIRAHVKDGKVTRISTRPDADLDEEMP
ncbi:Tat pathway signal sequence domain protein, partial [Edwardsiella tarda ATCC 23685]